ncbi:MAG: U32 family peptidase [Chitinispirillales bacterium]|jgi:putative protease|nr:U32 family peptidase [Chitinispirillales bacterium]
METAAIANHKGVELLAPAGSVESFHAAVDSGADAVYLGLDSFNARMRAKNFTARDLCGIVPYAHSRNVKVYVTLNTLIKQNEVKPALHLLYQLDQIGVDAVIAADIGLMRLASAHFPKLRLHGSTQAAVHNGHGAEFLKTLGVRRVVLARELSLDEIAATTKQSPIETEVFVHGALCYSISGQCLASSFIGGASGNRGRCTQVCRRRFRYGGAGAVINGYFFSPYDLQAIAAVDKMAKAGVASFKIEGRMKGAEYVGTVVKAYRRVIDSPSDVDEAVKELRFDFGRAKTEFFLDGRKGEPPVDPLRPSGTGVLIGKIVGRGDTSLTLLMERPLAKQFFTGGLTIGKGDRLRVQPENGFEGVSCKVADCKAAGDNTETTITVTITAPVQCGIGDYVFLIGRSEKEQKNAAVTIFTPVTNLKTNFQNAAKIANSLTPEPTGTIPHPKPKMWFKVDTVDWLDIVNATPCQHLIFDADSKEIDRLFDNPSTIKKWRSRMFVGLPPFIEEAGVTFWRGVVERCFSAGLQSFTVSNPGHFALVRGAKQIAADTPLWILNRFTQKELVTRGISQFVFSYEDEYLNIRDTAVSTGIVPVYGRPPLFISRIPVPAGVNCDTAITDPHDNEFFVSIKNGLCYTLPQSPVCLFARRERLSNCGIENFLIDLCFHKPDYETANRLVAGFKSGVKVEGGTIFNFKAGLR